MIRCRLGAAMVAAAVVATACGSGGSSGGNSSGSAANHAVGGVVSIDNESGTLWTCGFNPFNPGVQFLTVGIIYEPLYQINNLQSGKETPWLASSYQWSDANKTLTFTIRPGVKWSDGTPMTAADVAYTFNLLKAQPGLDLNTVWSVLSTVVQNGDQVVFTFANPAVPFFYYIADQVGIVPQHIWSQIADPVNENDATPVGTGPYTLGTCSKQNIEYVRNPNYWQAGLPKIAKVEYPAFLSNDAANNYLAAGQAQWGSQYIPNIDSVYTNRGPNRHWWFPAVANVALFPNLAKAPFDNPAVRQALAYAVDRNKAAQIGESGYQPGENQTGIVLPTYKDWYNEKAATSSQYNYVFNPDKATQLLTSAGYTKGSDGIMADASGKKLEFSVIVNSGYSDWIAALQVIEQEYAQVGIKMTTTTLGQTDYTAALLAGQFDVAYGEEPTQGPTPYYELRQILDSRNTAPIGQNATTNYERYKSPTVDALFDKYTSVTDSASQHDIINQIEEAVLRDVPVIPVTGGVDWYQYDTTKIDGWITKENPYAQPAAFAFPDWEVQLLHLFQK
jgi:peptide/nickel transport system substrate-binding protein